MMEIKKTTRQTISSSVLRQRCHIWNWPSDYKSSWIS